jgi:uncharacterized protein YcfJ
MISRDIHSPFRFGSLFWQLGVTSGLSGDLEMKSILLSIWVLILVSGCANDPIVDMRGVDEEKYQVDLAECRGVSEQVNSPAEGAKQGAVGAVVGGALGAIFDDGHASAGEGAAAGAIVGTTRGISEGENRKERVLFNCLKRRGYHVLG